MLELQKIATVMAMPYALVTLGLVGLWILIRRKSRFAAPWCFALLAIQLVCGAGVVAQRVNYQLERPYCELRPLAGAAFDSVVVLGGGSGETPSGAAQLVGDGDRLALAARMYQAGLVQQIVCTGDDFRVFKQQSLNPGEEAVEILKELGVPNAALVRVGGRTTREEMQSLSKFLDPQATHGLITSAWHMSRALRLAEQAGLKFAPLPADFRTAPPAAGSVLDWLPNGESAQDVSRGLKEWLAWWVGR